jgi:hypothetical protein
MGDLHELGQGVVDLVLADRGRLEELEEQNRGLRALLVELFTHDERGCGSWTGGMRRRVVEAICAAAEDALVVHALPPIEGRLRCCGRSPLDVAVTDRITFDAALVTCGQTPSAS